MKNLKILILMPYYDRPEMVKSALNSILRNNKIYENWEFVFVDDGSKNPGRPVVEQILKDHLHKVKFYRIDYTMDEKIKQGGPIYGKFINQAIKESDAELAISLADDDVLMDDYFFNLNKWFNEHYEEPYCCSDLLWFDPSCEIPSTNIVRDFGEICKILTKNQLCSRLGPAFGGGITIEIMAWKTECNKEGDIWYPYPDLVALDNFKVNLWKKYGEPFKGSEIQRRRCTDFYGVYKSCHTNTLSRKYVACGKNYKDERNYKMIDVLYSGI